MYYLQSRYYNPEWGRFINADGILEANNTLVGNNLYNYCCNNPVNRLDKTGKFFKSIFDGIINIINALVGGRYSNEIETGDYSTTGIVGAKITNKSITTLLEEKTSKHSLFTGYIKQVSNKPANSTIGIEMSAVENEKIGVNLGLKNTGISAAYTDKNTTYGASCEISIINFSLSFNVSVINHIDDKTSVETYATASISGGVLIPILIFAQTGSWQGAPTLEYSN